MCWMISHALVLLSRLSFLAAKAFANCATASIACSVFISVKLLCLGASYLIVSGDSWWCTYVIRSLLLIDCFVARCKRLICLTSWYAATRALRMMVYLDKCVTSVDAVYIYIEDSHFAILAADDAILAADAAMYIYIEDAILAA
jgi:hypothetical protein